MSAPDPYLELAPLAALDALDGDEAREFAEHARTCEDCRRERDAFATVGQIALAVPPVAPPPALRARVLGATVGVAAPAPRMRTWPLAVAATLVAAVGAGWIAARQQAAAERELRAQAEQAVKSAQQATRVQEEMNALLTDLASRTVTLAALPAAPRSGGRVVWNPARRRAVLFASGLDPAPAGKAYEVWVIAGGAPVPSGLFQVDGEGRAVADLPWLEQTADVKTFAVTLEPAAGTPAPTGPMVMAGNAG